MPSPPARATASASTPTSAACRRATSSVSSFAGVLVGGQPGPVERLVRVGVAHPGDERLGGEGGLDGGRGPAEQLGQPVDGERRAQRVDAQAGERPTSSGAADHPDGQALLGAHLGDVEARPVVQADPEGDRAPAGPDARWPAPSSYHRTQPPRARWTTSQRPSVSIQTNLPRRSHARRRPADQLLERRIDRLQGGERRQLAPLDPPAGHPGGQAGGRGLRPRGARARVHCGPLRP